MTLWGHFQDWQSSSGGGFLLLGGLGLWLRSLPTALWEVFVRQVTLTITVKDDDAAFHWVKAWLFEQRFQRTMRRVDLDTSLRGVAISMLPAPGTHLFWYEAKPFLIHFERSDASSSRTHRRMESLRFQMLGRNQAALRQLVDKVVECHQRKKQSTSQLYSYDDYWCEVQAYSPRLLDAILLPDGEKERLVADLSRFRTARERYRQLGVPYHRGYLFYGPPGSGKTSLVSAIASSFGLSIYALNLTELNDRTLKCAMNEVPPHSVILFEDIDCMAAGHRRSGVEGARLEQVINSDAGVFAGKGGVTLSGLLNVLDGFHAPENVIFAMTTNDVNALDPALLRPGRIDYRLYLGEATEKQKAQLYKRFFPHTSACEAIEFARANARCTMAEFQGLLLKLEEVESISRCEVELETT